MVTFHPRHWTDSRGKSRDPARKRFMPGEKSRDPARKRFMPGEDRKPVTYRVPPGGDRSRRYPGGPSEADQPATPDWRDWPYSITL